MTATATATGDATGGAVEVATLLSTNLEAYEKADGRYPAPGTSGYQQVVGIDQAQGYTIGYGVNGPA